jgi:hypothetical protein
MFLAVAAILVHLQAIWIILLVLVRTVVAIMANRALKSYVVAHSFTPLTRIFYDILPFKTSLI